MQIKIYIKYKFVLMKFRPKKQLIINNGSQHKDAK